MHLSAFIHQKSYERIEYQIRRHAVTFIPIIVMYVLLLAATPAIWLLLTRTMPSLLQGPVSYPLLVLLGSVYCLSVTMFFYTNFITFYLDLLIITNDRLMSIKQLGIFSRTISELDLYKIQDVTSEVHGVFASLFHYGRLTIETAGTNEGFIIEDIPNPEFLRQRILDLAEDDRKYHTGTAAEKAVGLMP